jgi:hypothetical protein
VNTPQKCKFQLRRARIKDAEEWAAKGGCLTVGVGSTIVRQEAHPFYEKLDFERAESQHNNQQKREEGA